MIDVCQNVIQINNFLFIQTWPRPVDILKNTWQCEVTWPSKRSLNFGKLVKFEKITV